MVYLATSEKEFIAEEESKIRIQKRQLKRSRIIAIILGSAAIISIGFMLFAFIKKLEADTQKLRAEEQTQIAEEQSIIAEERRVEADKEKLRAEENATIAILKEAEALQEKERAETQKTLAERNAELARQQQSLAEKQTIEATTQRAIAEQKEKEALQERERAFSLRMLAVGKQMSVKSLQVEGQQDLQTLLAYQAYIFNKRYQGSPNDADIYAGLYNAVRKYGGEHYKVFKGHEGEVKSVAFVPGKNEFYTSGQDGKIIKWILDGKAENFEIIYSGTTSIEVLAVSPDASWLAAGDDKAGIRMIPLGGGSQTGYELKGHSNKIKSIVFSYDGTNLYTAALDGRVLKWDLAARTSRDINDNTVRITSIDVSGRGKYLAGISDKGEVLVWNQESDNDLFKPDVGNRIINTIRFDPSRNILAFGDMNGLIELWDVEKREKISEVKGHAARVSSISFNPVFNQLATGGYDKVVKIWDMNDLTEPPLSFSDNEEIVLTIQFSSKGDALISAVSAGSVSQAGLITSRATRADILADNICFLISRNLSEEEWNVYVGRDIDWEKTCNETDFKINVQKRQ
jgi:hypothetical protein